MISETDTEIVLSSLVYSSRSCRSDPLEHALLAQSSVQALGVCEKCTERHDCCICVNGVDERDEVKES